MIVFNNSAVMCLDMRGLEDKVEQREIIADKLEKTRSLQMMTGKRIMHRWIRSVGMIPYLLGSFSFTFIAPLH